MSTANAIVSTVIFLYSIMSVDADAFRAAPVWADTSLSRLGTGIIFGYFIYDFALILWYYQGTIPRARVCVCVCVCVCLRACSSLLSCWDRVRRFMVIFISITDFSFGLGGDHGASLLRGYLRAVVPGSIP